MYNREKSKENIDLAIHFAPTKLEKDLLGLAKDALDLGKPEITRVILEAELEINNLLNLEGINGI